MKYLVTECHPGYAVVMDEKGRILRAANQNFQAGQTADTVVAMQESKSFPVKRLLAQLTVTAACLCLIALAVWQLMAPYGTVRMRINPDVRVTVNRLNYVIRLLPLNKDAKILLDGYDAKPAALWPLSPAQPPSPVTGTSTKATTRATIAMKKSKSAFPKQKLCCFPTRALRRRRLRTRSTILMTESMKWSSPWAI